MTSIYKQASNDIFQYLDHYFDSSHHHGRFQVTPPTVTVSFMEIAGDNVSDLLNGFHATQLRASADGTVHACPITECKVTNAEELMEVIQHGLNIRTTAATGVHDQSSRSHAILKIYIQRLDLHGAQAQAALTAVGITPGSSTGTGGGGGVEGTLTLVDLAGSEHRIDSMYHGKERRKETSYINASLMALKECIRSRAKGNNAAGGGTQLSQHVYRKSKLTMALKASFFLPHAKTIVIATVSPASKDTEHSLNTLRHACIMNGQGGPDGNDPIPGANAVSQIYTGNNTPQQSYITGGNVTTEQIGEINVAAISKRNHLIKKQNGGNLDELKTSNGNNIESTKARQANKEVEMTEKMKNKLRRMSEAKSFSALPPHIKEILKSSRNKVDNRQCARIQSNGSLSMLMMQQEAEALAASAAAANNKNDGIEEGDDEDGDQDEYGEGQGDEQRYEDDFTNEGEQTPAGHGHGHGRQRHGQNMNAKYEEDGEDEVVEEEPVLQSQANRRKQPPVTTTVSKQQQQQASHRSQSQKHYYGEEDQGIEDEDEVVEDQSYASSSTTNHRPRQGSVSYQNIYDSIFIAKDSVPIEILFMQLRAMLRVHGYSEQEIETLIGREKQKQSSHSLQQHHHNHHVSQAQVQAQPLQTRAIGGNSKLITSATIVQQAIPKSAEKTQQQSVQPKFNRVSISLKPDTGSGNGNAGLGNGSESRLSISRSASASDVHHHRSSSSTSTVTEHQQVRAMVDNAARDLTKLQQDLTIEIPAKKATHAPVVHSARRSSTPRRGEGSSVTTTTPRRNVMTNNADAQSSSQSQQQLQQQQQQSQQQKALADARQKVEEEARQRKARQDAAKAFREDQERQKKRSATPTNRRSPASKVPASSSSNGYEDSSSGNNASSSFTPRTNINHMSVDEHSEEINRLSNLLEGGGSNNNGNGSEEISSVMKYSIKKQIQLHRAAILKAQRAAKSNNGETSSVSPYDVSAGGGGGGGGGSQPRRVTGAERYGSKPAATTSGMDTQADAEDYGVVSAHGRPLNKQLAQQVLQRNQGQLPVYHEEEDDMTGNSGGGLVRHSQEFASKPSQEIDLRFDRDQEDRFSYYQQSQQQQQQQDHRKRSSFSEGREDFVAAQQPVRSQSRGRLGGGGGGGGGYSNDDRSVSSRGSYSGNTNNSNSNSNNNNSNAGISRARNIYY